VTVTGAGVFEVQAVHRSTAAQRKYNMRFTERILLLSDFTIIPVGSIREAGSGNTACLKKGCRPEIISMAYQQYPVL
jgi:hypothetical protein